MMSLVIPSLKYSCSGSPLRFVNGSTAMEGLLDKDVRVSSGETSFFKDGVERI